VVALSNGPKNVHPDQHVGGEKEPELARRKKGVAMTGAARQLLRPDGSRYKFENICAAPLSEVATLFERGLIPSLAEIVGWEYQGRNLGLTPTLMNLRRFIKGFLPNPGDSTTASGYNLWAKQRVPPQNGNWVPFKKDGVPIRHGFYRIKPVEPQARDNKYPHALFLDYSLGRNPWYHPGRLLRDYMVQVYADNPHLLVGRAYVALGRSRLFSSFFVLKRATRNEGASSFTELGVHK
jgi:hypothetical protein